MNTSSRAARSRVTGFLISLAVPLWATAAPGTVVFANHNGSKVVNGHTSLSITMGDGVRAALYWSPLGTNLFVQIGASTDVGEPVAGVFAGGTRTCGTATEGGAVGQFQVRAWSGGWSSYEQAVSSPGVLVGQSSIFQLTTGNPAGAPPMPPNSLLAGGFAGLALMTNAGTPLTLTCYTNKKVSCDEVWGFDAPTASGGCIPTPTVTILSTLTNGSCPWLITRTWQATDGCVTNQCSQTITVVDTNELVVWCAPNKVVSCITNWDFDLPTATGGCCVTNVSIAVSGTVTNTFCPQRLTRSWAITNLNNGGATVCSQTVTILCPDCPVLGLAKNCPPYPVPPGGVLHYTGSVTNLSDLLLTNVVVLNDHPVPGTVVFGPASLAPGQSAAFSGSYTVSVAECDAYADTLQVVGTAPDGLVFSNSVSVACPRATVVTPGDQNGDGIVDQSELDAVLANYWPSSPWLLITNTLGLGQTHVSFSLSNSTAGAFSVLTSTNLVDWGYLGPATPRYEFTDTNAPALPQRHYRLSWP